MTISTEQLPDDWMERDNVAGRTWHGLSGEPFHRASPLARLARVRTDGVRAAGDLARKNGRMLRVVRYVRTSVHEVAAQLEALELTAQSRHLLVLDEVFRDPVTTAPLVCRPGLADAQLLVSAGRADGILAPTYEDISSDLGEYEAFLHAMADRGCFVALALPETGR
ncbi:hypothetical protein ACFVHW_04060 [Streptomyces sp. NPDC127110]|uniref:hypothetical protein n=1 Tax=Streptomyces sp. NPDC127110 TaxID=3345362 RepID=UPI00363813B1